MITGVALSGASSRKLHVVAGLLWVATASTKNDTPSWVPLKVHDTNLCGRMSIPDLNSLLHTHSNRPRRQWPNQPPKLRVRAAALFSKVQLPGREANYSNLVPRLGTCGGSRPPHMLSRREN